MVGHIFCTCDCTLHSSGSTNVYSPNLKSLVPASTWSGTKDIPKVPTRSEATVWEFDREECLEDMLQIGPGRLPVGVPGVPGNTGFSAIPHGRSFKSLHTLSDPGVDGIFNRIEALELAFEQCKFVEIFMKTTVKTTVNLFRTDNLHINSPTHVCPMTESNLL